MKIQFRKIKTQTSFTDASLTGILKRCFPEASSGIHARSVTVHIAPVLNPFFSWQQDQTQMEKA